MSQYQRMISYLYRYEKDEKKNNIGYARIELRGDSCRVTVQLRDSLTMLPEVAFFRQTPQEIQRVVAGRLQKNGNGFRCRIETRTDSIMNTGYLFSDMDGLLIYVNHELYYATTWKDNVIIRLGNEASRTGQQESGSETSQSEMEREKRTAHQELEMGKLGENSLESHQSEMGQAGKELPGRIWADEGLSSSRFSAARPESAKQPEQPRRPEGEKRQEPFRQPEQLRWQEHLKRQERARWQEQQKKSEGAKTQEPSRHQGQFNGSEKVSQPEQSKKLKRPEEASRPEQPGRLQGLGQSKQSGRLQGAGQLEQPGRLQESGQSEQPERLQGAGQLEQPGRLQGAGQLEQPGRLQEPGQLEQPERLQKPGQSEQSGRLQEPGQSEQPERLQGLGQPGRLQKSGQPKQLDRLKEPGQLEQLKGLDTSGQLKRSEEAQQPSQLRRLDEAGQPEREGKQTEARQQEQADQMESLRRQEERKQLHIHRQNGASKVRQLYNNVQEQSVAENSEQEGSMEGNLSTQSVSSQEQEADTIAACQCEACRRCPQRGRMVDFGRHILDMFPRMYPFEVESIRECVRLELKDIGCLPVPYWSLAGNPFLLHGYYCYRHILFTRIEEGEYFIGVPGIFNRENARQAKSCGFKQFRALSEVAELQGAFGYWLFPVSQ